MAGTGILKELRAARAAAGAALMLNAALVLSGCGKDSNANTTGATNKTQSSVDLSSDQLSAIKIAPATVYAFPVEKEAIGSISYADDPNLIQAENNLLSTAAQYELTRKALARVKSLGRPNGIAEKDLEQATSDEQTAESAYVAARDALHYLGKTYADIDRMAAKGKIDTEAPERQATKWIVASLTESDSVYVRPGQALTASVMALPDRTFKGSVSEVYSAVDPNAHRLAVRAQIADPRNELRGGMLATVLIEVQPPQSSIGVPENSVVREGDGTMTVWVTSDRHHFVQRIVKTGLREDARVQILQGVRPGETVVTDGAVFLDNMLQAAPSD